MTHLTYSVDGSSAVLTLARPAKLNALTPEMLDLLVDAIRRAEADRALRCVILRGEGRAFCVGADVGVWSSLDAHAFRSTWIDGGHRAFEAVARCRLPVVAVLHGPVLGGGLELALAADLRIAEEGATLALPELSLGVTPGWGGTQRLPELVGPARAKQIVLTAAQIDAVRAEAWGLVNEVTKAGEGMARAKEIAGGIASLAPVAVEIAKRLIDGHGHHGSAATLEMLAGVVTLQSQDASEGAAALRERRPPRFMGL